MTGRPGLEFELWGYLFLVYWHLTHTLSWKGQNVYLLRRVKVVCILDVPEERRIHPFLLGKDWVLYFWKSSEYCTPPNLNCLPIVPSWSLPPKCHFGYPRTWRTRAQLVILWGALCCHHFVLSWQWSDFGIFLKLPMAYNGSVSVGDVSGASPTDVCRGVFASLLLFVFMAVLTCCMCYC